MASVARVSVIADKLLSAGRNLLAEPSVVLETRTICAGSEKVTRKMAEAASSSSSSSPPVDALDTPTGKRPRSESYFLTVRSQPPSYVFPNERFEFDFAIDGGNSTSASPPTDVEVLPSLVNVSPASSVGDCLLQMLESPRISPSRKTGTIKCFVRSPKVSRKHGCSLQIQLRVSEDRDVASCTTRTVSLVNTKLNVTMSPDWKDTWFKDEGGRDKCMEGDVIQLDDGNQKIQETLALDLVLCYAGENYVTVSNQDFLRRIGSERFQIESDTGSARIRFRVEDVSKNHQGQTFVVKILPGKGSIRDIAPAFTPPVSVRSKRNRQKQRPSSGARASSTAQASQAPAELVLPAPSSDQGRRSSLSEPRLLEGADPIRLRSAVQAIVRWADEVVNSLYYMRWQVIGYEHRPDGSMDYNRPLHNIQNPNPAIDRVLTTYNDSIRDDLGFLQNAVEQGTTSRAAAAAATAAGPSRGSPYSTQAPAPQTVHSLSVPTHTTPQYSRGLPPPQPFARHPGEYHQQQQYPMQQHPHQPHTQPYPPGPYYYPPEQQQQQPQQHSPSDTSPTDDRKVSASIDRESEVEYVLAKQYKSIRTGERLGFPAFSVDHELLGFYRESTTKVGASHFEPIRPHEFGPSEKQEAKKILEAAIANKSDAVHALKDWGSMARLIDHCLVYNFSKDIAGEGGS